MAVSSAVSFSGLRVRPINPISGMTVLDEAGEAVEIDRLWRDGGGVLVFVRHFG